VCLFVYVSLTRCVYLFMFLSLGVFICLCLSHQVCLTGDLPDVKEEWIEFSYDLQTDDEEDEAYIPYTNEELIKIYRRSKKSQLLV